MARRTCEPYIVALLTLMLSLTLSACDGDSEDTEDASMDSGSTPAVDMPADVEDMPAGAEDMPADVEDMPEDMPAEEDMPAVDPPVVSLTITPDVVTEEPASEVTFTLTLDRDPPQGGTRVYVLGDVAQSLTQLNLLQLRTEPEANENPEVDLDSSGFTLLMKSREVSVSLSGFPDGQAEEPAEVTFQIVPFDDVAWGMLPVDSAEAAGPYAVGTPNSAKLTLRDAPEPPDYDPALERVPARIVHLSPGAGALDVCARVDGFRWIGPIAEGEGLSDGIDFGATTGFLDLPLGSDRVRLVDATATDCATPLTGTTDLEFTPLTTMSRTSIAVAGEGAQIEAFATEQLPAALDQERIYVHIIHALKGGPEVFANAGMPPAPCADVNLDAAFAVVFSPFEFGRQGVANGLSQPINAPDKFKSFYVSFAPTTGTNTFETTNQLCENTAIAADRTKLLERDLVYSNGRVTTIFVAGTAAQPELVQCTDLAPGTCTIVPQ